MTLEGWLQIAFLCATVLACVKPLGLYMGRLFGGEPTPLDRPLRPLETAIYRLCRVDPQREMNWLSYLLASLAFSAAGLFYLFLLLRTQAWLPLNPQHVGNVPPALAWNTAVSFVTNTNWQFYSGENTLSYLSQMAGLAWHNFTSAGVGIALLVAFVRGIARSGSSHLGNFWVDLTRACLYVLVPLSVAGALLLVWTGVPQNFHPYLNITSLDGFHQTITGGPMASQEAIKELGTNGGGFVGQNSASPNENPTPLSNWFEMWLILVIPAALTYTFGYMVKDRRQGWALLIAMSVLFLAGIAVTYGAEAAGNPLLHGLGVPGGNLEGKETRFGVAGSALFAVVTTATSCGAVNTMLDSFTPLGGLVPMLNIQLGEIIFGGVGSGLYGMLIFVILTVFIAGLMVGRTPEYLGKKIGRREVQLAILFVIVTPLFTLVPTAVAVLVPAGLATRGNLGPHGFSEILYAFSSTTGNNGSAFAGLGPNTFYLVATGLSMFFGRFAEFVPLMALAGLLAAKRTTPASAGTMSTSSPIFVVLLIGTILIVGALIFFPADALGPMLEHLLMLHGVTY